ncbi:MAG: putative metal-binding motif-containing protein [Myxococcales bacterium]|nr:putative metal-binding motif-containing protein [Myxococcales bacterium]
MSQPALLHIAICATLLAGCAASTEADPEEGRPGDGSTGGAGAGSTGSGGDLSGGGSGAGWAAGGSAGAAGATTTGGAPGVGGMASTGGATGSGGAGGFSTDTCGNGLDDDGDGDVDEGCSCTAGATQPCYGGNPKQAGVGICKKGTQTCGAAGEFPKWSECTGDAGPAPEICNGKDDDCDGQIDENACQCVGVGASPWQKWLDTSVHCFGGDLNENPTEFNFVSIPDPASSKWKPHGALSIDFTDPSTIPSGDYCGCKHCGGVFTYFQTFFEVPQGKVVKSLIVSLAGSDDGVKVWLNGKSDAASVVFDGAKSMNLTSKVVTGKNRLVLVHIDDNPTSRKLTGVKVLLNGLALGQCP